MRLAGWIALAISALDAREAVATPEVLELESECKPAVMADLCRCIHDERDARSMPDARVCEFEKISDEPIGYGTSPSLSSRRKIAAVADYRVLRVHTLGIPIADLYLVRENTGGKLGLIAHVLHTEGGTRDHTDLALRAFKQVALGSVNALWIEMESSIWMWHEGLDEIGSVRDKHLTLLRLAGSGRALHLVTEHSLKSIEGLHTRNSTTRIREDMKIEVTTADGAVIVKAKRGKPDKAQLGRHELPQ